MGWVAERRDRRDTRLANVVKSVLEAETAKASIGAMSLPSGATASAAPNFASMQQNQPSMFQALARSGADFGNPMGPGSPLFPNQLDPNAPGGSRPGPRKYQYEIADNLNINKRLATWSELKRASYQIDVISRSIAIRIGDIVKMDWAFRPSEKAVQRIMIDNNIGRTEAVKVARQVYADEMASLTDFWENPYPDDDRSWEEWITEAMWQVLVFDGLAVVPAMTLGAKLLGFEIVDSATIKLLHDNYGRQPLPPAPAFQQVLWGFPRSEFVGNSVKANGKGKTFQNGINDFNITDADVMSYFVMNRRSDTLYGFSPTEMVLPIANLYAERLKWLMAEYRYGTSASVYFRTTDKNITPQNLASYERMVNDGLAGLTDARYMTKVMPPDLEGPFFRTERDEKYKPEWDEYILKRVASHYGIQPTQLGVIPRTGLGGKGAAEGEQDAAEMIGSKPQVKHIERFVNSLSSQHLQASGNVVFNLYDDEGSEDSVETANAAKIFVSVGVMTLNEQRQSIGLGPLEMPEADEPVIITPTGPVFIRGAIAAQEAAQQGANNAPSATPQPQAPPTAQEGEASPPLGQEDGGSQQEAQANVAKALQATELETFSAFIRSRAKRGGWRDFTFTSLDSSTAKFLCDEASELVKSKQLPDDLKAWVSEKVGLAPLGKRRKDPRAKARLQALADEHAAKVANALKVGGTAAVIASALEHARPLMQAGAIDPATASAIVSIYEMHLTMDSTALKDAVNALHQSAIDIANNQFVEQTGSALGQVNLQGLLDQASITIKGMEDTTRQRVLNAVSHGMAEGKGSGQIAQDIRQSVNGPMRLGQANMIARTEASRAYNYTMGQQIIAAGYQTWDWALEGPDPCPECEEKAGSHDISDTDYPPLHPNCWCEQVAPEATTSA